MAKRAVCVSIDEEVWKETRRQCDLYGLKLSDVVTKLLAWWNRVPPETTEAEAEPASE